MIKYYITDDYVATVFDILDGNDIPYTLDKKDFITINTEYETKVDDLFSKNFIEYKKAA